MLATTNIDLHEIQKRAAEIRGTWSPGERRRRMGLPPDTPTKLRDILVAPRSHAWAVKRKS
jgi:hypothetical protein